MVSRMNVTSSNRTDNNNAELDSSENPNAAEKSKKSRQTSLRNFFGTAPGKRTVSFASKQSASKNSFPLTPPTPISPQTTPPTPPTEQEDSSKVATPPSPDNVAVVFKKAKRESSTQPKKLEANSKSTVQTSTTFTSNNNKRQQKKNLEQTYLDLGQANFGKQTICNICGMLYVHGLNEDSKQHDRICMDYMKGVPFTVPQARVVATYSNESIVEVRHSDSYALRSKVKRVKEIVDRDLGFAPSDAPSPQTRTTYLYVANKRVIGMASAEIIPHAYVSRNALERSTHATKAMAGIHQLWVHAKFRKQGIATRLVDAVRAKLVFGLTVPLNLLAFSSPTEAGANFARNYVGSKEILVYDCS